jgi:Cyclophilin type peptidyl-prolyl cis-trans isomerase/CLD
MTNGTLSSELRTEKSVDASQLRRTFLSQVFSNAMAISAPSVWKYSAPMADAASAPTLLAPPYISAQDAKMTHRVFFNVRISRADGTFYVRDDDATDDADNQVYSGQLVLGLFGHQAPHHVQQFLQYVVGPEALAGAAMGSATATTEDNETPYPSYSRSSFTQYDDATGVLYGGTIPSLEVVELQNSVALQYGNRLLPAKLWVEESGPSKISHDAIGLLTHKQLDLTPAFGITTRADTTQLNPTHTVFGQLVLNPNAEEFLRRVTALPTYSVDGPVVQPSSMLSSSSSSSQDFVDETDSLSNSIVASSKAALYRTQREFFRNTAKTFGDTRVSKLYDGKILRRVEVTQVGLLK